MTDKRTVCVTSSSQTFSFISQLGRSLFQIIEVAKISDSFFPFRVSESRSPQTLSKIRAVDDKTLSESIINKGKCLSKVHGSPAEIKSNRIAYQLRIYALTPFVSCQRGFCFSRLFCFRSVVVIDVFSGIACLFNNECALKHWIFERIVVCFCVISPGFVLLSV